MQLEETDAIKNSYIAMRLPAKSDEKVLAKFHFDSLPENPLCEPTIAIKMARKLFNFNFSRKRILHYFSKKHLENWDKILFYLIICGEKPIGFTMITWIEGSEKDNRSARMHELYLLPKFRGKKIEQQIVGEIFDFCREKKLHLGFTVNPLWELFEEEK